MKITKACEVCGAEIVMFPYKASTKRFCSRKCTNQSRKLQSAGHSFTRADGYVSVYYPSHPNASANGTVMQHRLVMEESIGRLLLKSEVVHHLNGIRHDNRIENLQLLSSVAEHSCITNTEAKQKRMTRKAELAEYRKRFGPLT